MFTPDCKNQIVRLNYVAKRNPNFTWKPHIILLVHCVENELINPLTGEAQINRKLMLIYIAVTDFAVALIIIIWLSQNQKMTEATLKQFEDLVDELHTKDFAIEVSNLPPQQEYKNQQILKCMLW